MIRGHVVLSLYLLVGMIVIVDLYVGCAYLNDYFDEREVGGGGSGNGLTNKDIPKPRNYPGLGVDFGFDDMEFSSDAEAYEFHYQIKTTHRSSTHLNLSAPIRRLMEENISVPAILNYVTSRILDHHDFRRPGNNGHFHYYGRKNLLRTSFKGLIWVRKEVVDSMQQEYIPYPTMRLMMGKRKRGVVVSDYDDDDNSTELMTTKPQLVEKLEPEFYDYKFYQFQIPIDSL